MSKVLVTGGAGFIGSHLVSRLLNDGYEVVVLDNMKRGKRNPDIYIIEQDIRNFDAVKNAAVGCEIIFHLAAQSNVIGSLIDPEYGITTNVLGTLNILQAAKSKASCVVFSSSREVYGEAANFPVSEVSPLHAKNLYGASKIAGEAYCTAFEKLTNIPVRILRFSNVYGPGDSERVIPIWVSAAQNNEDIQVFGGDQIIDFLWKDIAVNALLFAAKNELPGPVNIGSGVGTKISDLANLIVNMLGSRSTIIKTAARNPEVTKFIADIQLMTSLGITSESDPLLHLKELF